MSRTVRRTATVLATLALAAAAPLVAAGPAVAAPATTAVAQTICGSALRPCLSLRDVICWEDNLCQVPVTIAPYAGRPIRVDYVTRDATAVGGENYVPAEGSLVIQARSEIAYVPVMVRSSRTPTGEPATLTVILANPTSGVLVTDHATVTISVRTQG